MEGSRQLEYSPAPPLHRRRRFRRVVLLVVLCALVYPGWRFGPGVWGKGRLLYAQRRCLNYEAPVDRVVYESRQPQAAELLKRHGYHPLILPNKMLGGMPGGATVAVAAYIPDELNDFETRVSGARVRRARRCSSCTRSGQGGAAKAGDVRRGPSAYGPIFRCLTCRRQSSHRRRFRAICRW